MSRGRPLNPDLYIKWKISLPATLAGRVEHLLMDPVTGKPKYGSRQKIIVEALQDWVRKQGVFPDDLDLCTICGIDRAVATCEHERVNADA